LSGESSFMRQLAIVSLKGGTGKSTLTVNLGRAFQRQGHRVGLLDVDVVAPTLHKALGVELPRWSTDSEHQTLLPSCHDGIYMLTIASFYGPDPAVMLDEPSLVKAMQNLNDCVAWPPLDYLLLDSPPSSSVFMQALYDHIRADLHGAVLVFQPSDIAAADLMRTFDFLHRKEVPLIGVVSNMAYCRSPKGEEFWPFLSPEVDLKALCDEVGIPILGEVPLTPDQAAVNLVMDGVARNVQKTKPRVLRDDVIKRAYKACKRGILKAVVKRL